MSKNLASKRVQRKSNWKNHLTEVVSIVSEMSTVLIQLRARPKPMDWFAIGLRGMHVASRIQSYVQSQSNVNEHSFFQNVEEDDIDEHWIAVGALYSKYVKLHIKDAQPVVGYGSEKSQVMLGDLDGITVGFISSDLSANSSFYVRRRDWESMLEKVSSLFWKSLGTNFVHYTSELTPDESSYDEFLMTRDIEQLTERVKTFYAAGLKRSYLIEGVPGSGKSTAVKMVARELGLRTVRLDFTALNAYRYDFIRDILVAIKPDVIIIDDLDRVGDTSIPIPLVEEWREQASVIFVTVNHMTNMADALLRPGRLDDLIAFNTTHTDTVRTMLEGCDEDLIPELSTLPIAYVKDFLSRRQVLGSERARMELKQLDPKKRMARSKHRGDYDVDNDPFRESDFSDIYKEDEPVDAVLDADANAFPTTRVGATLLQARYTGERLAMIDVDG